MFHKQVTVKINNVNSIKITNIRKLIQSNNIKLLKLLRKLKLETTGDGLFI